MTERKKRGPLAAIALLIAAAVLLAISGTQTARAALTYFSQDYAAQVQMYDIGVTLTENGQDVSWRNYTQRDDVWNQNTGVLLKNLLPEGEQLQLGRTYPEVISVRNTGSIDQYVRVKLYTYWTNADGSKNTELSPDWIDLHLTNDGAWVEDASARTAERRVLYYTGILPTGAAAPALSDTLTINDKLAAKVTETKTTNDKGQTVITTTYDYDGVQFNIEAEVDAVQTHNAEDAILSAWGVKVNIRDGHLSLR
ncbi:hypothetical protein [Gemmiger sp.]